MERLKVAIVIPVLQRSTSAAVMIAQDVDY